MHGPAAFAWTSGELHGDVLLGAGLLAVAYAVAWARGPRRHAGEPVWFFAGLGVLLLALNGPLHDLSDYYLFSAHMVQHLLLTLVVAPLLLAGTPAFMLDRLLGPLLRSALGRFAVRATTRAVPALALYAVALIGWHLPLPYNQALERHGWHVVEHLVLLATSVLAWWPVVSAALGARAARRSAARRSHHVGPGRAHPSRRVHGGLLPLGRRRAGRGDLSRVTPLL